MDSKCFPSLPIDKTFIFFNEFEDSRGSNLQSLVGCTTFQMLGKLIRSETSRVIYKEDIIV